MVYNLNLDDLCNNYSCCDHVEIIWDVKLIYMYIHSEENKQGILQQ